MNHNKRRPYRFKYIAKNSYGRMIECFGANDPDIGATPCEKPAQLPDGLKNGTYYVLVGEHSRTSRRAWAEYELYNGTWMLCSTNHWQSPGDFTILADPGDKLMYALESMQSYNKKMLSDDAIKLLAYWDWFNTLRRMRRDSLHAFYSMKKQRGTELKKKSKRYKV